MGNGTYSNADFVKRMERGKRKKDIVVQLLAENKMLKEKLAQFESGYVGAGKKKQKQIRSEALSKTLEEYEE